MGRRLRFLAAAVLGIAAFAPGRAAAEVLTPTPYMGLDTWYAVAAHVDEATVLGLADAIVRSGLRAAGYRYLWIDGGWWDGTRDAQGQIVPSAGRWPHGMHWLTDYLHARGLRAGIYTDAGTSSCAKEQGGSYGHYQTDVNAFAAWGFDAVKVDFCGGNAMGLDPRLAYRQFGAAIASDLPRRPLLFNVCDANRPDEFGAGRPAYALSVYTAFTFAAGIANSWRTSVDIGQPGEVTFEDVLRNIDHDALHPEVAGPGHWNDPDYLVPGGGLTRAQSRAQFTMWTILAAPLMLSLDVRTMPGWIRRLVTNPEAIAISQDRQGIQGRLVARVGDVQLWVKPLARRGLAVALLNRGPRARSVRLGLGLRARHRYRDVWNRRTGVLSPGSRFRVPGDGAVLLRILG